jgi:hypothetical protein
LFDSTTTREYEIDFADGTRDKYHANVIADNRFAQVDSEGNQFLLLQEVTDHKKDHSAVPIGVASRNSIRLAFLIAALNDLDIMSCDLENAYLNAPYREMIWFVEGGIECGEDQHGVKVCIVVHSLYGLKSAGAALRSSLAQILQDLGYKST